jgi:nucleoporin NUP2
MALLRCANLPSQNFIIYPGLSPTSTSHFVSFVGHEDGSSTAFKLRLKTEADAGELKAAMDREIALVQVKTP